MNEAEKLTGVDDLAEIATLVQMMAARAYRNGEDVALIYGDQPFTYGTLWRGINNFAAYLEGNGVSRGDRVILSLKNSERFFSAYYGVQRLGAVSVPIFNQSSPERIGLIARLCGAKAVVTEQTPSDDERDRIAAGGHGPMKFLDLDTGCAFEGSPLGRGPQGDDLAMLQYTSGTTGDPKGVQLTHANLLANIRQINPALLFSREDVFVSWLPVYHDMGLITMTMCPFYNGAKLVLLETSPKPFPWLNAIATYGGTMTAAPDFGYRFCTKFSKSGDQYNVSSLRRGLIAAEPVRESTVRRFEEKFSLNNVLRPGYGLAEASVGVSFWGMDRGGVKVDADGNVSAGRPIPGMEVAIEADGRLLPAGERGEIVIRSLSCTAGYYRNPEATDKLQAPEGYIRTGDIGYIDQDGDLFIVGRAKNIIIRAGRNLSPREIEEVVEEMAGVRLAAALGIDSGKIEGEQIHVFVEADRRKDVAELVRGIMEHANAVLGFRPDKVHPVKAKTIPRTYSGKLQYNKLRDDFLAGRLADQLLIDQS